ncbi:MAG: single-stranded-DNA-specific exonuclease RecJ [Candidatus Hydrogenedentota bacterium]
MQIKIKSDNFDKSLINDLSKKFNISQLITKIILSRGLKTEKEIDEFLNQSISRLHNPFSFKDMKKAVDRIRNAILMKEKILIYGDRDVDGICAVVILFTILKDLGAEEIYHYISDSCGYGLHKHIIDIYIKKGVSLIITTDCGIRDVEAVNYANSFNIDCIITDHHEPAEVLPEAYALICSKIKDDTYPDHSICGATISYKLAQALIKKETDVVSIDRLPAKTEFIKSIHNKNTKIIQAKLKDLLILSGIATIADVVPLIGENRIISKFCLSNICETEIPGLQLILKKLLNNKDYITVRDIAFKIAPLLNSPGRFENSELTFKLLTCTSTDALESIKKVLKFDKLRKEVTLENSLIINKLLEEQVDKENDNIFLLIANKMRHGVTGIVANRILAGYSKPVIILINDGREIIGAGRSNEDVDLIEILKQCQDCLKKYGGHSQAVGLTLKREKLQEFKRRVKEIAKKLILTKNYLDIDMCLNIQDISFKFASELSLLEPFGCGNPEPLFLLKDMKISEDKQVGKNKEHIKIKAQDNLSSINMVYFNGKDKFYETIDKSARFDIIVRLYIDEYLGIKRVNTVIEEIYPSNSR